VDTIKLLKELSKLHKNTAKMLDVIINKIKHLELKIDTMDTGESLLEDTAPEERVIPNLGYHFTTLSSLDLTSTEEHALYRSNVTLIMDLHQVLYSDIIIVRRVGSITANNIVDKLNSHGMKLRREGEPFVQSTTNIIELNLSKRTHNGIHDYILDNYTSWREDSEIKVGHLVRMTETELRHNAQNIGETSIAEIRQALSAYNLYLATEPYVPRRDIQGGKYHI